MPPSLICYCDFWKHLLKQSTLVFILTVLAVCVGLSTCMHRGGRLVSRDQSKVSCCCTLWRDCYARLESDC